MVEIWKWAREKEGRWERKSNSANIKRKQKLDEEEEEEVTRRQISFLTLSVPSVYQKQSPLVYMSVLVAAHSFTVQQ